MTCIVAIKSGGKVYVGGDSCLASYNRIYDYAGKKVFEKGGLLFGVCGSPRMLQLIEHVLNVPDRPKDMAIEKWLASAFVDSLRECLKAGGHIKEVEKREGLGCSAMIIAIDGRIFTIDDDFQASEISGEFHSIGSGDQVAIGALYATKGDPKKRIIKALEAAAKFTAYVRPPFNIVTAKCKKHQKN